MSLSERQVQDLASPLVGIISERTRCYQAEGA